MINEKTINEGRQKENIMYAVSLALISYLASATMGVFVKFLPATVSLSVTLFAQYFFGLLVTLFFVAKNPKLYTHTSKPLLHFVRISSGMITFGLFFWSLYYITLVNGMVLRSTTPFFIPLILLVWKKQRVSGGLWAAIVLGFIGVVCIIKPSFHSLNVGTIIALGSGFVMAIAALSIRRLGRTEPPMRVLFYYFLFSSLVFLPFFLYHIKEVDSLYIVGMLLGIGICMYVLQYGLVIAFSYGKTSTLAPIAYSAILFSGLFDWFFWRIIPDFVSFIGIFLIIFGALLIVWQQKKQEKLEQKAQASSQ